MGGCWFCFRGCQRSSCKNLEEGHEEKRRRRGREQPGRTESRGISWKGRPRRERPPGGQRRRWKQRELNRETVGRAESARLA